MVFFVNKRLAFGSAINTKTDVNKLRSLGITHVINLRRSNNRKVRKFSHLWLPFKDDKKPRPRWFFKRTLKFYRKARRQRDAKLLVTCLRGICRSASLTHFILRFSGLGSKRAEAMIKSVRPSASIVRAYRESGEKYLRRMKA
jgi:protein-tyrosine phosphatase